MAYRQEFLAGSAEDSELETISHEAMDVVSGGVGFRALKPGPVNPMPQSGLYFAMTIADWLSTHAEGGTKVTTALHYLNQQLGRTNMRLNAATRVRASRGIVAR